MNSKPITSSGSFRLLYTWSGAFAFLFPFFILTCFSQQLPYKTIGLKDGLPQSIVYRMVQDHQGYMWLATPGGVCRYDGSRFDVYSQYDGIGAYFIINMQFDDRGQLWVATYGNGIACFNGQKFTNFNRSSGLISNQIRCFIGTSSGDYFVSTIDTGIVWVDKYLEQKVILDPDGKKILFARDIRELPNGNIWIGCNHGIIELDKKNNYSPKYILKEEHEIICFETDQEGDIWAGGDQSLWEFKKGGKVNWSHLIPEYTEVWDLLEDRSTGSMYIATTTGLIEKNGTKYNLITSANGLTVDDTKSLVRDRNGNIWVGTLGGGAVILENKGIDHFTSGEEVSDFAATTMVEDTEGNIWIGTNNQGLLICDGNVLKKPLYVSRNDIKDPFVSVKDPVTGDVFFAEYEGTLIRIRNGKVVWKWQPRTSDPLRILGIHYFEEKLFITTYHGVYSISEKDNQLNRVEGFGDLYASYSFSDPFGYLWILSDGGKIMKWKDGRVEDLTELINPTRSSVVQGLYDPVHQLYWFCSYSGLIAFNGKQTYKLHSKNGIHSDSPWSMILDHSGNIWLGLPNGVECIDFEKKTSQFLGYDQGFTPIETNSCVIECDKEGNVWFGTICSATRIRVNDIKPKKSIVDLWIQHITVNEVPVFIQDVLHDKKETLILPYYKNNLVIDLNGICFDNAKDVKYSWHLSGLDEKWTVFHNERKAIYSNLPPGTYQFKARAMDPNGFEAKEVDLKIIIKKPVWNRWWFYTAEVLVMIFLIFLSFRFTSNPSQNKLGNLLTLVSILIIFEAVLIYVSGYVNKFTGGVPIFQLIMNVILAGTLHPLEQGIRKLMRKWAFKKKKKKMGETSTHSSD